MSDALKKAARDALGVQNASNLCGVLAAWHRAAVAVMEETGGNATEAFLHHPVNVLFASKVSSLLKLNLDCIGGVEGSGVSYHRAYEACEELAGG